MQPTKLSVEFLDCAYLDLLIWDGPQPACVFVHGFADNAGVWTDFAARLGAGRLLIAPDLRGHGCSSWDLEGNYSIDAYASDITCLLDRIDRGRVTLVGHSLGAEIVAHVALQRPERVDRLILVDFGAETNVNSQTKIRAEFQDAPRLFPTIEDYVDWLSLTRPMADPVALRSVALRGCRIQDNGTVQVRSDPAIAMTQGNASAITKGERTFDPALAKMLMEITAPALVVRGAGSSVLPQDAAVRLAKFGLRDGRLAVVERAGHSVMLDNPGGFYAAVSPYISVSAQTTTS